MNIPIWSTLSTPARWRIINLIAAVLIFCTGFVIAWEIDQTYVIDLHKPVIIQCDNIITLWGWWF